PGADPLRDVLTRYGTAEQKQAAVPPSDYQPPPPAANAPTAPTAPTQLQPPRGAVQQQSLPPPRSSPGFRRSEFPVAFAVGSCEHGHNGRFPVVVRCREAALGGADGGLRHPWHAG